MLKVQWEFLEKNVGRDGPLAIMRPKNNPEQWILRVYGARDYHCCAVSPEYSFLKPRQVLYLVEKQNLKQHSDPALLETLSAHDHLVLRLKEGCKIIEEDCKEQANRIIKLLS